ncbi:UDP-3-O-(3-hydroxymyristoyl)glucosamine N-acyltransferase [Desulfobulbus rhabdoformis]|uniref:UDP-3-O-(3-hydroxymyristoyl)glucosamine N-acyltransferase n=1 Tax=Desulfobulbus rhabdoformis TaxID=34032 RepID=UPI0019632D5F|nr:UDP-3-O-(3-hydroxymyristoyl)glucosamine N-acyltransferase [Desulfobulbus rhabdoformis]
MEQQYTLQQLAEMVGGQVQGDPNVRIHGLNGIEYATEGEITFVLESKQFPLPDTCKASACIAPAASDEASLPLILCENPSVAAAKIHLALVTVPFTATGIHPSAVIGQGCTIPEEVSIGPLVSVGNNVCLGQHVTLHPGVVIEDGVSIGDDTVLYANVTVTHDCIIGKRVILYHGVVIGSDGFGFATDKMGFHHKKPQVGIVRVDDDVEIGANSCVDRAAFGVTWIKSGTRIDNLAMVGHNVVVGENSVLVAQVGIAGSTTLGRNVVLGAKTGVAGHLRLDDQVMAAAMSGIHNSQPRGAMLGGIPAIDVKKWGRSAAAYNRLPEMMKEMRRLRKEVEQLKTIIESTEQPTDT